MYVCIWETVDGISNWEEFGQKTKREELRTGGWMDRWIAHRLTEEWMDEYIDGWTYGWMDVWTD